MKNVIHRISLDMHKSASGVQISCKSGDVGRYIHITLTESGKPYEISSDCTAVIRGKKGDEVVIFNECNIISGMVVCEITSAMLSVSGIVECEITLYGRDSNDKTLDIASARFELLSFGRVQSDSEIEGTNEYTALTETMVSAKALVSEVEQKLENGELKGEQGEQGLPGKDGKDGADGKDGINGADGKDGLNGIDGKDGSDGYTPIKGVDYYTETEKAEFVQEVLSALPNGDEVSY